MKHCPHCKTTELTVLDGISTTALGCPTCHGLWLPKPELMQLSGELSARGWFDIALWEESELLAASPSDVVCPIDGAFMSSVNWNETVEAYLCADCGGLWLPSTEYKKILGLLRNEADTEVMADGGEIFVRQLALFFEGKKSASDEIKDLRDLLQFLEYRFAAKHPALTELIERLPFAS